MSNWKSKPNENGWWWLKDYMDNSITPAINGRTDKIIVWVGESLSYKQAVHFSSRIVPIENVAGKWQKVKEAED